MAYKATFRALPLDAKFEVQGSEERAVAWLQQTDAAIPTSNNRGERLGERHVLALAPSQWLLVAPIEDEARLVDNSLRVENDPDISLVQVSDQYQAFEIDGEQRLDVLAQATSLPLASMQPGDATYTEMFGIRVILWLMHSDSMRLYVERSYADFLLAKFARAIGDASTNIDVDV